MRQEPDDPREDGTVIIRRSRNFQYVWIFTMTLMMLVENYHRYLSNRFWSL